MSAGGRGSWTLTGRHVLIGIVGFFLVVFAVNGVFLYLSLASHPGVTTEDAYRKGLDYNRALEEAARQRLLGWQAAAAVDADGAIEIRLADASGRPLHGVDVSVDCRRPAHQRDDRTFRLRETGPGTYRAPHAVLPAGRWALRFEVRDGGGKRMRVDHDVVVRR